METQADSSKKIRTIAIILLALSVLLCLPRLMANQFGDEYDTLVMGKLITEGEVPYRDVFSHHFPLPYYWTAMVVSIFGHSVFAARFSIVILQGLIMLSLMHLTKAWLPISLSSLAWSVLRTFYYGHMSVYPSFSAIFCLSLAVLTFYVIVDEIPPSKGYLAAMVLFSLLGFLSDPLMVYPIAIAGLFLIIKYFKIGLKYGLYCGLGVLIFLAVLLVSGFLVDFWENVIVFNSEVYSKYSWSTPFRFRDFFHRFIRLLDITQSHWYDFNPIRPFPASVSRVDSWFFTGFFYRIALLLACLNLLVKKKWYAALFLYSFSATVLVMRSRGFYAQPFNLLALFATMYFLIDLAKLPNKKSLLAIVLRISGVFLLVMVSWLTSRAIYETVTTTPKDYEEAWQKQESYAQEIARYACDQSDVELAAYPGSTGLYWFSDLKPVGGYLFMWPWVAEFGLQDIIIELSDPNIKAIVLSPNTGEIWGYAISEYMMPLHEFVTENYTHPGGSLYLSPALVESCKIPLN